VTLVVQVNGKVRARLDVPAGSAETDIERLALAHPQVSVHLAGRPPRKVVVIPDKLVNVVG
jgi:leucyl-tRNA synthetase